MAKLKVLNAYCGIGGNRKLWQDVEVTAIENNLDIANIYKDFFPKDKVYVEDAHQYLLDHYQEDIVENAKQKNITKGIMKNQKSLFGGEYDEEVWKKEWRGMPEFIQEKQEVYAKIIFRFDNEEDLQEFAKIIGQKLTNKTKSAWYPFRSHWGNNKK
jgi:hypothetical protein|tara:strand:+ start:690 stop:1160 length:471 start_codon:yes stop_codon:yes gene_type:complete